MRTFASIEAALPAAVTTDSGARRRLGEWVAVAFSAAYILMLSNAVYLLFGSVVGGYIDAKAGASSNYAILWFALYCALLVQLRHELINFVNLFASHLLFGLFLASAITSYVLYPPGSVQTAQKLMMFVFTLSFGLYLSYRFTVEQVLQIFIGLSACILAVHWLAFPVMQSAVAYDDLARDTLLGTRPYGGMFAHKNLSGAFFAFAFLACYVRALGWRKGRVFICALAAGHLFSLIMAGAASALLCALMGASVATGVHLWTRRSKWLAFYFLFGGFAVVAVMGLGMSDLLNMFGRSADLSGRWPLFEAWPDYVAKHPLFGWGYSNFFAENRDAPWIALQRLRPYGPGIYTFENAYLELIIDFGIIGGLLFIGMVLMGLVRATSFALQSVSAYAAVPLAWIVFILFMGITDSGLRIHNLLQPAIVAWCYFGLRAREAPQHVFASRPYRSPS